MQESNKLTLIEEPQLVSICHHCQHLTYLTLVNYLNETRNDLFMTICEE